MKVIQMTLDEELIKDVDKIVKKIGTTRSAFTRDALRNSLKKIHELELKEKHRQGYIKYPVKKGEFDKWENEQVWVEYGNR